MSCLSTPSFQLIQFISQINDICITYFIRLCNRVLYLNIDNTQEDLLKTVIFT